jgi:hypothetical protein
MPGRRPRAFGPEDDIRRGQPVTSSRTRRPPVFAKSADGYSQPDSIAQWQTKVLI